VSRHVAVRPRNLGAPRPAFAVLSLVLLLAACGGSGDPQIRVLGDPQAAVPVSGSSQIVLTIANEGDGRDTLVGASTPSALGVELHLTEIEEGRAVMRELEAIDLRPGEQIRFRPGELHLMLVVPDETVEEGATFDLTLHFDRSDDLTVSVEVVPLLDLADAAYG
jgi:periplasmic copper chaperone A